MQSRRTIELDEHIDVQRRTWRVQRAGWVVMAVLLGSGLVGLFGAGPLSTATVRDPEGAFLVSYAHIQRQSSPSEIEIAVSEQGTRAGEATIVSSLAFDRAYRVERITPPPVGAAATGAGTSYRFMVEHGAPVTIIFSVKPKRPGIFRPVLRLGEAPPAELWVAVLP